MADVLIGRVAHAGAGAAATNAQTGFLAWVLSAALMLLALSAPALWNSFPLIFPDSGGYLERPLEGTLDLGRSAAYGLFLYAGVPLAFWPIVVAQSALTVWLIVLTLRAHGFGARPWLACAIAAVLAVATSLPWMAGQLLPDILFPAAILALQLLIFRADRLKMWERIALGAVIAFAIVSHMAAAGLCAGVVAAIWLIGSLPRLALPKPRLSFAAGAVAAGILLCPLSNWAITGTFAFTPGGSSFLFGRLVEDGIIDRYLDDNCPKASARLCAFKHNIPDDADGWLWDPDSPFRKLGGWQSIQDEEREVILATLARYPLLHLAAAINDTVQQFLSFQTEVSLDDNAPTIETFRHFMPQLMPELMSARQQHGAIDIGAINLLHMPVAALAIAATIGALVFRRRLHIAPELAAFCCTVLLALAINAAICGVFSHPVDRYQSRLAPLALFAVSLLAAGRKRVPHLGRSGDLA